MPLTEPNLPASSITLDNVLNKDELAEKTKLWCARYQTSGLLKNNLKIQHIHSYENCDSGEIHVCERSTPLVCFLGPSCGKSPNTFTYIRGSKMPVLQTAAFGIAHNISAHQLSAGHKTKTLEQRQGDRCPTPHTQRETQQQNKQAFLSPQPQCRSSRLQSQPSSKITPPKSDVV